MQCLVKIGYKLTLSNTVTLNFCYLKIILISRPRYHLKIIGHIFKNKLKNKCICIWGYTINHNENEGKSEKKGHMGMT